MFCALPTLRATICVCVWWPLALGNHYLGQPDWSPGLVGCGGRETWKHKKMTLDPTFHNLAFLFCIVISQEVDIKHLIDGYYPPCLLADAWPPLVIVYDRVSLAGKQSVTEQRLTWKPNMFQTMEQFNNQSSWNCQSQRRGVGKAK